MLTARWFQDQYWAACTTMISDARPELQFRAIQCLYNTEGIYTSLYIGSPTCDAKANSDPRHDLSSWFASKESFRQQQIALHQSWINASIGLSW
jgi:hypothetical protein